jgi:hypothetical protein
MHTVKAGETWSQAVINPVFLGSLDLCLERIIHFPKQNVTGDSLGLL